MNYVTPESVGIQSENVEKYLEKLSEKHLATHSIIMARGDKIFLEKYWKPFDENFLHRIYSASKSFVSIAIGFLIQDGKITLDDTMDKFFPDELKNQPDMNMHNQTVENMLTMATAKPNRNWKEDKPSDRVRYYFENDRIETRPPGTINDYDSDGSFVLAALVERVSKKTLLEYLREKLFDKIGVSKEIDCLKCPGGHSWGDSGILCKPMDFFKVARFMLNGGKWNGEQILDAEYVKKAVSPQIFNNETDVNGQMTYGYGYQFWVLYEGAFGFIGMGKQFAICVPKQDLILIYTADNQGKDSVSRTIIDSFFDLIVHTAGDMPLIENESAYRSLMEKTANLELIVADGKTSSEFEKDFIGKKYILNENPMKIKSFKIEADGDKYLFRYINEQGEKVIPFGMGRNVISEFPQEGYSDLVGTVETKGKFYRCATSAAWVEPKKLYIKVQIIDKYFGNLGIVIGFKDNICGIHMVSNAEAFLEEYKGFAGGRTEI